MKHVLKNGIKGTDADYIDAKYEDTRQLTIAFNKLDINGVSNTVIKGGRITALKNGGYAAAAFTRPENMADAVKAAKIGRAHV